MELFKTKNITIKFWTLKSTGTIENKQKASVQLCLIAPIKVQPNGYVSSEIEQWTEQM